MRRFLTLVSGAAVLGAAGLGVVIAWPVGSAVTPIATEGNVDRGAYLARASGCIACHTNFEAGGAPPNGDVG